MNLNYGFVPVLGMLAITFFAIWIMIRVPKKGAKFTDEQRLARGHAYGIAAVTGFILLGVYAVLVHLFPVLKSNGFLWIECTIFACVTIFSVYCLNHNAFFAGNMAGSHGIMMCAALALAGALSTAEYLFAGVSIAELVSEDRLTSAMMCIAFVIIGIFVHKKGETADIRDEFDALTSKEKSEEAEELAQKAEAEISESAGADQ